MRACRCRSTWRSSRARRAAIALPASTSSSTTRRQRAAADQRAELRPLQDLRHQGPDAEHRLGPARGRRRPQLRRHVREARWLLNPIAIEVLTAARLWPPMMEALRGAFEVHDRTHQSDPAAFARGRAAHPRDRSERRVEGAARADRAAACARDRLGVRRRLRRHRRRRGARARHRRDAHAERAQRRGRRPGDGARPRRLAPPHRGRPLRAERRLGERADAARTQGERRAHGHRRPRADRPGDREARRGVRHVDRLHGAQRRAGIALSVLPERRGARARGRLPGRHHARRRRDAKAHRRQGAAPRSAARATSSTSRAARSSTRRRSSRRCAPGRSPAPDSTCSRTSRTCRASCSRSTTSS